METAAKIVGSKIRFYRKSLGLTLEQLSALIFKSKSTLSKYENGSIPVDIDTLFQISRSLNVNIYQLIGGQAESKTPSGKSRPVFFVDQPLLYAYHYDGRKSRIVKSVIYQYYDEMTDSTCAHFYLDIADYKNYERCEYLYSGAVYNYDIITYFFLENLSNHIEKLNFIVLKPLHQSSATLGIVTGISYMHNVPVSLKAIFSKNIIQPDDAALEALKITKQDLRNIKNLNMLMVHN